MISAFVNAKLSEESLETIPTFAEKLQHSPYPSVLLQYGAKKQYETQESTAPSLDDKAKRFIQSMRQIRIP